MSQRNWSRPPQPDDYFEPEQYPQRRWYQTDKGMTAILAVLALLGFLGYQAVSAGASGGSNIPQASGTVPTTAPTPTPTPTPKGPHQLTGAVIGGTEQAFTDEYGQPNIVYGITTFSTTAPDGASAVIRLYDFLTGTDGQKRVDLMGIAPAAGGSLSQDEVNALVKQIMPPDSKYVRDVNDPNVGVIHVYQSADLALSMPPAAFGDSNGGPPWPRGTFSVSCDDPSHACTIGTGV